MLDLVPLWTVLLGLAVFYYVVFDGFDLGVGMLYGFMSDPNSRNIAMNSIAPIWAATKPGSFLADLVCWRLFRSRSPSLFLRSIFRFS